MENKRYPIPRPCKECHVINTVHLSGLCHVCLKKKELGVVISGVDD